MDLLLACMNWFLAVLLYLHSAKILQAAPTLQEGLKKPSEGLKKPSEVIKFMEVYQRSVCQPMDTLVDIFQEYPEEVEYIFKPSCVVLKRCAGCCSDESLECVPSEYYNVTMQIMRLKPYHGENIGEMSFLQHKRCECRPKKDLRGIQEHHCEPCSEKRKHLFVQEPQSCRCSCKFTESRCKSRQLELNETTCRCEKPRR